MNIRAKIYGSSKPEEPILRAKQPKGAKADELDSVTVQRDAPRRNSRTADRHRLTEETVRLTHDGHSDEAQLVNLSGGGAMIDTKFQVKLWDSVELHLGDHGTIECVVRWIRGGRVGLEFAHETRLDCATDEHAQLLRETVSRSFPDIAFEQAAEEMPEEDDQEPAISEQRRAKRHPLIWSGVLHHDYQSTTVRIRNISATGAMLESASPVRVGAQPLLELGPDVSLSATVEWAVGDQIGLRFDSMFDMSQLARSEPKVAPATWVRPAHLEQTGSQAEDSPWDPRWERLSVGQLKQELDRDLNR
jgi:hypothetical protein